jgi:hypothetical protein
MTVSTYMQRKVTYDQKVKPLLISSYQDKTYGHASVFPCNGTALSSHHLLAMSVKEK